MMFYKALALSLFLIIPITHSDTSKAQAKKIIKEFFTETKTFSGIFHQAIIKGGKNTDQISFSLPRPESLSMQSGLFFINLSTHTCKWKYLHPYVRQLLKASQTQYFLYKEGQSTLKTEDGIEIDQTNTKKPCKIYQPFPATFIFDQPVDQWINTIEILGILQKGNLLGARISFSFTERKSFARNQKKQIVDLFFQLKPLTLIGWRLSTDKLHNVTLTNISINKPLPTNHNVID